jgi:hypothetical protein
MHGLVVLDGDGRVLGVVFAQSARAVYAVDVSRWARRSRS